MLPTARRPARLRGWLLAACLLCSGFHGRAGDYFIAGADCSHLKFFEDRGVVYRANGEAKDAFEILKQNGLNCVRLRLFTSSKEQAGADPYNRINNLDYTLPLAVRTKEAGLKLLLNLHYSDTWADPGKQAKPSAWTNLTFADLEMRVHDYTRDTITAFKNAGALPDYVQPGNEIIGGFLWPEGRVGGAWDNEAQWTRFGTLLKAAIRGVKSAAVEPSPTILMHIDRGGDRDGTRWFFDNLARQQVDYDWIALSYYPFWHGSLENLRTCLSDAAARYARPVLLAETAFPWTNSAAIGGIPASPEGQVRYVAELASILKNIPERRGAGVCWWGSEYQPVSGVGTAGFQYRGLFDAEGNLLPSARALGDLTAPIVIRPSLKNLELNLRWPLSGAGLTLMSSSDSISTWVPVGRPVASVGSAFQVTLPADAPTRLFRLEGGR